MFPTDILTSPRVRFVLLAVCSLLLVMPAGAFAVTREAVLQRAEVWVARNVPYSQSRYADLDGALVPTAEYAPQLSGYRTDCSGFVSMALGLKTTTGFPLSLDTASLPYRCTEITGTVTAKKAALRPGDLMVKPKTSSYGGHVVVFVRWYDAAKTKYVAYHESGSSTGTIASVIPYPYYNNDTRFRPFRYKLIEESQLRRSRRWLGPSGPNVALTPQGYGTAGAASSTSGSTTVTPAP